MTCGIQPAGCAQSYTGAAAHRCAATEPQRCDYVAASGHACASRGVHVPMRNGSARYTMRTPYLPSTGRSRTYSVVHRIHAIRANHTWMRCKRSRRDAAQRPRGVVRRSLAQAYELGRVLSAHSSKEIVAPNVGHEAFAAPMAGSSPKSALSCPTNICVQADACLRLPTGAGGWAEAMRRDCAVVARVPWPMLRDAVRWAALCDDTPATAAYRCVPEAAGWCDRQSPQPSLYARAEARTPRTCSFVGLPSRPTPECHSHHHANGASHLTRPNNTIGRIAATVGGRSGCPYSVAGGQRAPAGGAGAPTAHTPHHSTA